MQQNKKIINLQEYYNKLYKEGKEKYWNDYSDSNENLSESQKFIIDLMNRRNIQPSSIFDFGCGEGNFLSHFGTVKNRVGVDFSSVAIENAISRYPEIKFILGSENQIEGTFDLVTSIGIIEHTDDPFFHFSKLYKATNQKGYLIIVCPNHCNTRGVIWQTLSLLFNVPMSLADRHVINYSEINEWISINDFCEFFTIGNNISMGQGMIKDLRKRLTNALQDAKMDNSKVDDLIYWLENNYIFFPIDKHSGWLSVFLIQKGHSL